MSVKLAKLAQQGSKEDAGRAQTWSSPLPAAHKQPGMAESLLTLQRTHGNRFVQRLLHGAAIQRECACGGTCSHCQTEDAHRRDHASIAIPLTPPVRGRSVEELDQSAFA